MDAGTGGGFDWWHALSALGGGAITAVGAAFGWIYKAGAREPSLRADFQRDLGEVEKKAEAKADDMIGQFQESFNGIRRQIDEHRLHTETNFVRKDDFKEFREEYREDMRDLKQVISEAMKRKLS